MNDPLLQRLRPDQLTTRRTNVLQRDTLDAAQAIMNDIVAGGDAAALMHAQRLGDIHPGGKVVYSSDELLDALHRLPIAQRELLERTADRIRAFACAQRAAITDLTTTIPGGECGHVCVPVRSAGCYAPGGRFPLPSSVLMTAVTARAAGVDTVWVASPRPTQATLAAASVAGADGLLAIGGVQAVAAMSRGLLGVPRCDMIVGPGNRWVTAAKQLVSDEVGIDMLAGPSELLILADHSADAALIAADLLAQAEHDEDAVPMLITTCEDLTDRVERELFRQLATLSTEATARAALRNGFAVVASTMTEAIGLSDRIGPEHLEIMTNEAAEHAGCIRNAGAIFIGAMSAEALGDYGAGPNHVLPTCGTTRFRAGLSVFSFLRIRSWMRIDRPPEASTLHNDAIALARIEGLEAHARSVAFRVQD
ncbi:MAG: histidinol dehydrogenase [Phycisphaerales bacterium]|nr:histidinol dehydrogenase [Phycisphaerales bacterium]